MVLLVPRLGTDVVANITERLSSDIPACMITQDVSALPTFNSHGGPITHSSTGSKPDPPVHPLFPKLFLTRGLVCNPRATVLVIYSGNRRNIQSHCSEPLSHFISGIERLPARLKLPRIPPYFALNIFVSFNSRVTFRHLPPMLSTR